jgi:hypothetical protein
VRAENLKFIALLEASGWSKAEAARQLSGIDRATVGRYVSGQITPPPQILELFEFKLAAQRPGALTNATLLKEEGLAGWERKIFDDLRWLHKEDRERVLKVIRTMIDGLPRRQTLPTTDRSKAIVEVDEPEVIEKALGSKIPRVPDDGLQQQSQRDNPQLRASNPMRVKAKDD